jgi:hypothetical protein
MQYHCGTRACNYEVQYMHDNPVKRALVTDATDYKYSSARFYVEKPQLDTVQLSHIAEIL